MLSAHLPATTRLLRLASFFKALGWDVENEAGLPHHQREVIVERGESETTGRPDYSFRIGAFQYLIFGVDIDPQAVEITMMSLYLKALEGEQSQLPPKQHLLPELKYNIMCGNSLIGPDIYDQGVLFADEERDRINAFDWHFVPVAQVLLSEPAAFRCLFQEGL